ncbi:hypothetical protein N7491_008139 [Penicillium cf. griseofulvum]|uniref:gamma-glutamylcyclotransferase n=1 Tax=Penicillium cf. griseofulvum TaxID=2972120 RepID=A0A9W9M7A7_9EURO|nr:hypothetical protein N7472_008831 [Penicillium cf. griseofulvum]KAJ5427697.1 hypothetical protein N7491_008139 [Penicillium cf. griseofulvum]KAJ5431896.1 hypothetical protein N7445_008394 [Penicillium cf. griseofulvum]
MVSNPTLKPAERHTRPLPTPTPPTMKTPHYSKYLYFAYGSNLSPAQMKSRCRINPTHSATPRAIATLPNWRWLICEAGYANVLSRPGLRVANQDSETAHKIPVSGTEDAVYGVLYQMDIGDEGILDGYEGVDTWAASARAADGVPVSVRPRVQGNGSYNKWFVEADVVKWLDGAEEVRAGLENREGKVPVLVYVDENCVRLAEPKFEYIARMNRAIRESVDLGVPMKWVEEVMRKFIPE